MSNHIVDIASMLKELQLSLGAPRGPKSSGHKATCSIRLDLPKFQGMDPEGWLFQVDEYFSFHGINDDSRIQIVGFHMTKGALSWMRGLCQNDLLSTWENFARIYESIWKVRHSKINCKNYSTSSKLLPSRLIWNDSRNF